MVALVLAGAAVPAAGLSDKQGKAIIAGEDVPPGPRSTLKGPLYLLDLELTDAECSTDAPLWLVKKERVDAVSGAREYVGANGIALLNAKKLEGDNNAYLIDLGLLAAALPDPDGVVWLFDAASARKRWLQNRHVAETASCGSRQRWRVVPHALVERARA